MLLQASEQRSGFATAFDSIAQLLINRIRLNVFGQRCRILEVEFYLHSTAHPDPFTHCHPIQQQVGQWYLHRVGSGFRGGSFKGIDLTFGSGTASGGILIRTLESAEGQIICGPSLCVDLILRSADCEKPADLDSQICETPAWSNACPLRVEQSPLVESELCHTSARVGLKGAKIQDKELATDYAARLYRFFIRPRAIKKGRPEVIRALLQQGHSHNEVHKLTGSPMRTIEKYASC